MHESIYGLRSNPAINFAPKREFFNDLQFFSCFQQFLGMKLEQNLLLLEFLARLLVNFERTE